MSRILIIIVSFLLVACQSTVTMTYLSDPPGAIIFNPHTDHEYGLAPFQFTKQWDEGVIESYEGEDCLATVGLAAKWASGAVATVQPKILLCPSRSNAQELVLVRPSAFPDRHIDDEWAWRYQQHQLVQRLVQAQERQVDLQTYQLIHDLLPQVCRTEQGTGINPGSRTICF